MSTTQVLHTNALLGAPPPALTLSRKNYAFLQAYIQSESGIVLDDDRQYLVESRLLPILREENVLSLDSLCQQLAAKTSPTLSKQVVEAMTTNETLFFRDSIMFEALRTRVLPSLFDTLRAGRRVRIW